MHRNTIYNIFYLLLPAIIVGLLIYILECDELKETEVAVLFCATAILIHIFTYDKKITFRMLFMGLCFVFFFGQVVNEVLGVSVVRGIDTFAIFNDDEINKSLKFTIFAYSGVWIGVFIGEFIKEPNLKVDSSLSDELFLSYLYRYGLFLIAIGILPKLYIDISRVFLYMQFGYNPLKINVMSGYMISIQNLVEYGIICLILSRKLTKKKADAIVVISCMYQILPFMCGVRARSVIFIIVLLYVFFRNYVKFNFKNFIVLLFCFVMFLVCCNVVMLVRGTVEVSADEVMFVIQNQMKSPIFETFQEFGNTLASITAAIVSFQDCPESFTGVFNMFIRTLIVCPKIEALFPEIREIFYVNGNFNNNIDFVSSLGGSFVCELYFDYGVLGILMAILIGVHVEMLNKICESQINRAKLTLVLSIPLLCGTLWWIRDHQITLYRDFFVCLFTMLMFALLQHNRITNN